MKAEILFFDRDVVVAKKPRGILSEGRIDDEKTMPGLIFAEFSELGVKVKEIFPVHRLDRETEGVMVYALNARAAAKLSADVAEHKLKKQYTATLCGRPADDSGELRDLLFFDRSRGKSFCVDRARKGVKEAILEYELVSYDEKSNTSSVLVTLKTGRTHQIRVQFASRKLPLVGDRRYGAPKIEGTDFDLTAKRLGFFHPTSGEWMEFEI